MVAKKGEFAVIPYRQVGKIHKGGIVCIADHASNFVPPEIDLGINSELLTNHIAIDIGTAGIAEALAEQHNIPAHIAAISRLVCDFNRDEGDAGLVPLSSDGHPIPGNDGVDPAARMAAYGRPYHAALAQWLDDIAPELMISLHSFTPKLASKPLEQRPWDVGLLYNRDARAAQLALPMLGEMGLIVGDNEPYSGKLLNSTMNRHAEECGRPYLTFEIRQDLITDVTGQNIWADRIARVAKQVALLLK